MHSPSAVVQAIAEDEKSYEEEFNRTFGGLGDEIFKVLRLLPATKQKIEWEKVATRKVKPGSSMAVCIYLEWLITSLMCLLEFNSFERVHSVAHDVRLNSRFLLRAVV